MNPSDVASAVLGAAAAAFVIWCIIRLVNDRRLPKVVVSVAVVGACLWLPFSWLVLMDGGWSDYRLSWLRMWPILPGFVPGLWLFHPHDALEFSTMAATTLIMVAALTWLAYRNRVGIIAAAIIALLISIPTAQVAYAVYCF
jgi:hypothetical protein